MYTTAFDPSSCALFAHVIEQTACTCLCSIRRRRIVPRARRWLHRNSGQAFDALAEDMGGFVVDWINLMDPRLAVVLILAIWLRVSVTSNEKNMSGLNELD